MSLSHQRLRYPNRRWATLTGRPFDVARNRFRDEIYPRIYFAATKSHYTRFMKATAMVPPFDRATALARARAEADARDKVKGSQTIG